jgi:hypothetical protein
MLETPDNHMPFASWEGVSIDRQTMTPATVVLSSAFLTLVALSLLVPLFETFFPIFGPVVSPLDEHRRLNPPPALHLLFRTGDKFAAGLNEWFDDRAGFRDLFIRTKNQIDYSLFGTSRRVYVGTDGWLFNRYNTIDPVADLDPAGLRALEQSFVTLAQRLNEKGVRLLVVAHSDKSALYPEMAARDMPTTPINDQYAQFKRFLASRSDLMFIDADPLLEQEKPTAPGSLYFKTDMHVTDIAQVTVVKEIVAKIAAAENRPDIHWDEKFGGVRHEIWSGGESMALGTLNTVRENPSWIIGEYEIGGEEPDGQWYLPEANIVGRADPGIGRPFDWEFRSSPELCKQRLPGMVLFGNSYSDSYWRLGLHRYFCFIRRARTPISRFAAFYDTMPQDTKYFIYQILKPRILDMVPPLK